VTTLSCNPWGGGTILGGEEARKVHSGKRQGALIQSSLSSAGGAGVEKKEIHKQSGERRVILGQGK